MIEHPETPLCNSKRCAIKVRQNCLRWFTLKNKERRPNWQTLPKANDLFTRTDPCSNFIDASEEENIQFVQQ